MSQLQDKPSTGRLALGEIGIFLLIVALSLVILLTQNPSSVLPRTALYFDAGRYLETCKRMYDAFNSFVHSGFSISKEGLDSLAYYIYLDGPVLPGLAMLMFLALHKVPDLSQWAALVNMQCVIQALTAGGIYLIGRQLLQKRCLAIVVAMLWTLYPTTITSCNTFLTEPLACFLSVQMLYGLTGGFRQTKNQQGQNQNGQILPGQQSNLSAITKCLMAGIALALYCLLKAALAPAAAVILLLWLASPFMQNGRGILEFAPAKFNWASAQRMLAVVIGIALVMAPWLEFGYASRGQLMLLTSRRPVYNIAVGCNPEGDGWGLYPTHPVALMYDDNDAPSAVAYAFLQNPQGEIANNFLRKLSRLWNLPWNDYRYNIFGLGFRQQAVWQLILIALGMSGLLLIFVKAFGNQFSKQQKLLGLSLIILVTAHLIYLPFEGIGRYGYTAMPFLILAAGITLEQLLAARSGWRSALIYVGSLILWIVSLRVDLLPFFQAIIGNVYVDLSLVALLRTALVTSMILALGKRLSAQTREQRVAYLLSLSLTTLLAFSISFAFAVSRREAHAWSCTLKNGAAAQREILVDPKALEQADWAIVMVDGDQRLPEANILLNGNKIKPAMVSLYQFDTQGYELEDWLNQFASLIRKSPESIRRWKAAELPLRDIKPGWNSLSIQAPANGGATIYGDYLQQQGNHRLFLPSPEQVSPGKFFNDSDELFDSRVLQTTFSPISESRNSLLHDGKANTRDLAPAPGVQQGNYRIYLLLGYAHDKEKAAALKRAAIAAPYTQLLTAEQESPPATGSPTHSNVTKPSEKHFVLDDKHPAGLHFELNLPPQYLQASHFQVSIGGKLESTTASSISVAGMMAENTGLLSSILPGTPQVITGGSQHSFEISSQMPCTAIKNKNRATLKLELKPISGDSAIDQLYVRITSLDKAQFNNHSVRYF